MAENTLDDFVGALDLSEKDKAHISATYRELPQQTGNTPRPRHMAGIRSIALNDTSSGAPQTNLLAVELEDGRWYLETDSIHAFSAFDELYHSQLTPTLEPDFFTRKDALIRARTILRTVYPQAKLEALQALILAES